MEQARNRPEAVLLACPVVVANCQREWDAGNMQSCAAYAYD